MRAIILAAGRGSRLGSLTDGKPKCLVEVAGCALFDWQISSLRQAGISQIGAVRGYRGDLLEGRGLTLFDNANWATTNMVQSLACSRAWLEQGSCIVSYSDIFYPAEMVERLAACDGDLVITYDRQWLSQWSRRFADPLSDCETFVINERSEITEIGKKPRDVSEVQGQYMGLLKFTPASWARVVKILGTLPPELTDKLDMTSLLSRLIGDGLTVTGIPVDGGWGEVDNPEDIVLYESMIAAGDLPSPPN